MKKILIIAMLCLTLGLMGCGGKGVNWNPWNDKVGESEDGQFFILEAGTATQDTFDCVERTGQVFNRLGLMELDEKVETEANLKQMHIQQKLATEALKGCDAGDRACDYAIERGTYLKEYRRQTMEDYNKVLDQIEGRFKNGG